MGIYDRDYYREASPGLSLGRPRTAVVTLVLVNVAVWLINGLFFSDTNQLDNILSARVGTLTQPWMWWQFVTYGFVHDPHSIQHILFNMITLWFFGRDIEQLYGRAEFLRLYFVLLAVGGVAWAAINKFAGQPGDYLMGASGAVTGVVLLYALNFPRRMILFMFILPMPAWVLGVLMVVGNMLGAFGARPDDHTAYVRPSCRGGLRLPLLPRALELRPPAAGPLPQFMVPRTPQPAAARPQSRTNRTPTRANAANRSSTASWKRSIAKARAA